ncbi:MAG: zf-HC2 domain-containing protein [Acidobacteria bacterium]|nr:zf-HC2 domain-containing protein [Acidobacteriota bacterium]MBI3423419.1 zf-HC2 domain-containing protein [Acidobacteriota bacterium]
MDCTRVEELLALFSGDDLDARQTEQVRVHVATCPACQAQADELAASHAWLRAVPPPQFDEAFYAGLRQAVLCALPPVKEEGGRFAWLTGLWPQWRWQPVWAAVAAALLLVIGWAVYRNVVGKSQGTSSVYTVVRPSPTTPAVATPSPAAPPPDVQKVSGLPGQGLLSYRGYAPDRSGRSPKNSNVTTPGGRRPPAHQAAEPQGGAPRGNTVAQNMSVTNSAPVPEPEMMRMEIQTADPNIRIIWLTPKATAMNPTEPQTR